MGSTTNKSLVAILVNTLAAKGLRHVVASPGSRNAPLVIAFQRHPDIEMISVPDERSAAFFALGMAQYTDLPTALICTSGTAGLIFQNYVKASFQYPTDEDHVDNHWYANRIANEAYNQCVHPHLGPVHINVPLREPLYDTTNTDHQARTIEIVESSRGLYPETAVLLKEELKEYKKILILCGQIRPKEELSELVKRASLRDDVAVLSESISNFTGERVIPCIDRTLDSISDDKLDEFVPDLLITFDGPVISKKIKAFLRKNDVKAHWHVGPHRTDLDTFHALTKAIVCSRTYFVDAVLNASDPKSSDYSDLWRSQFEKTTPLHKLYLEGIPFCDLKIFETIINHLPSHVHLQLGNSSVVRYVQLFDHYPDVPQYSNRGTSGIDGCTSTAAGYAHISDEMTLLITGDLSFLYDTNGLWHNHLSSHLRIIVINNGGGGIFKIINGPNQIPERDQFFVAEAKGNVQSVSKAYGLRYLNAGNSEELEAALTSTFFEPSDQAIILEIFSDRESDQYLKGYFKAIKA